MAQTKFNNEQELLKVLSEKLGETSGKLVKKEIDDIKSKIINIDKINDEELEQVAIKIDTLNKIINENGGTEKLLNTISENSEVITKLKNKLEEKVKDFESVKTLLDTLNGNVSDFENKIKSFNDYKKEVENRISNNDNKVKKFSDEIENIKSNAVKIDDINISKENTFSSEKITNSINTITEVKNNLILDGKNKIEEKCKEVIKNSEEEINSKLFSVDTNTIIENFKIGFNLIAKEYERIKYSALAFYPFNNKTKNKDILHNHNAEAMRNVSYTNESAVLNGGAFRVNSKFIENEKEYTVVGEFKLTDAKKSGILFDMGYYIDEILIRNQSLFRCFSESERWDKWRKIKGNIELNKFYQYVIYYNKNTGVNKIYINGKYYKYTGIGHSSKYFGYSHHYIGFGAKFNDHGGTPNGTGFCTGEIRNVYVFNRKLSDKEIKVLYNNSK